jgi:hypothetical protein
VTYWQSEFCGGREDVDDSPRTGGSPNFGICFRIERGLKAFPNESVRTIATSTGSEPSTVFNILTQVVHLKSRHWRWITTHCLMIKKMLRSRVQNHSERNFSRSSDETGTCFGQRRNHGFSGIRSQPDLGFRKCHLGWVPYSMTQNQAQCRVTFSEELLQVVRRAKETNFEHLLTGDESLRLRLPSCFRLGSIEGHSSDSKSTENSDQNMSGFHYLVDVRGPQCSCFACLVAVRWKFLLCACST